MNDGSEPPTIPTDRAVGETSEMRLATVMMVDMVGSTEIGARLGPEDSFLLMQDLIEIARTGVSAHGGVMVGETGDGFFALFGAPVSIERAALAACRAGLDICAEVRAAAGRLTRRYGVAPELRVGLAAGEVLITGHTGRGGPLRATGSAVNLAARLETLADPNGVVCSESVVVETEGWVRFEPLGPRSLKGFAEPVQTYRLQGIAAQDLTPARTGARGSEVFVGRSDQLTRLMAWDSREDGGRPVSLIVGEAGIGKSRLLAEFAARRGTRRLILGACTPNTTARPLAPLIELLRNYAEWSPEQRDEAVLAALAPVLPLDPTEREALVKLIAGRGPPDDRTRDSNAMALRRALTHALTLLGQRPECLVALEDIHWIDPLSGEVLMDVIAAAPARLRMLGTTRPVDWLARLPQDRIDRIETGPIEAVDIGAIVQALTGEAATETLVDRVTRTSEGNPFFAIEILHQISASGAQVQEGRIGAVQNIALARFDRLEAGTKALLRLASVQGRSFRHEVLEHAAGVTASTLTGLPAAAEGIIEPDPSDPGGTSRFRHILFRDSIYATIPATTCKTMHLATAQALEACEADGAQRRPDRLAEHYERAGAPVQAVQFLNVAARDAYDLYALQTCAALMERAFRLIETEPDRFARDMLEKAVSLRLRCLDVMDQFRPVIAVSDVWLPRLRSAECSPTHALLLALTSKAYLHMGNVDHALALVTEALEMATRLGHDRAIAYAKVVKMRALTDGGHGTLEEVEQLFEDTRAFTEDLHDGTLYANRMFHMMAAYRAAGLLRRANAVNDEIEAVSARHENPHVALVADWNRALHAAEANDFRTALFRAEPGLEAAARNTAIREVFMNITLFARLGLGIDVPLAEFERIRENSDRRGELVTRNAAAMSHAFACFFKGQIRDGWRALRECEPMMAATGTVEARRFFLLLRAELLLTLRGDIPSDGPPPNLKLAEIPMVIYLRFVARRRAKALLTRLLSEMDRADGLFVARAQAALAAIAAAEGRSDAAREGFDLAERLFRDEGLTVECARLANLRAAAGL